MARLTAVLLVGGEGTRLRPLTYEVPKPLVPVANRPLTAYSLRMLRRGGVERAILATGYMAEAVKEQLAGARPDGLIVECVEEREALGTAGGIRNALPRAERSFIAMNGDQLLDVDVADLLRAHRETRAAVTVVVTRVPDRSAYGTVRFGENGRVEAFEEKRKPDEQGRRAEPGWINAGMYVWSPRVIDGIPEGQAYSNETQLFPDLIRAGEPVFAYRMAEGAYWTDVGTPAKYLEANGAILKGATAWADAPTHPGRASDIAPDARISQGSRIGPNVSVGDGVEIGRRCAIRDSILLEGAIVHEGCTLRNVIVMPGSEIAPDTVLSSQDGAVIVRGTMETRNR